MITIHLLTPLQPIITIILYFFLRITYIIILSCLQLTEYLPTIHILVTSYWTVLDKYKDMLNLGKAILGFTVLPF